MNIMPVTYKILLRQKARLNINIARDLSANFGGKKADYLKRLNGQLRKQRNCRNGSVYPKAA
jgi:hypothetical protein